MKSKRLLSALLTVVLVVTLTPVNVVFAAAGEGVYVNTITSPLDLTSGDVSGDGYSWDSAANTLTLTGLCIDLAGDTSSSAIKLPNNNTTLIVEGTNKIIGGKAAIQLASGSGTFTIKGADEENPSGNILEIKDSVVALSINNRSTPVVWEDVTFYSETEGLAAECPYGITFRNSDISVTATSEKST